MNGDDGIEDLSVDTADEAALLGQHLIDLIFSHQPYEKVVEVVDGGAPLWYQDAESLSSALHAAAHVESNELLEYLIKKGSIWNAVDSIGNCAGDIALSLNNEIGYRIVRDAGLRTEFLLSVLPESGSDSEQPEDVDTEFGIVLLREEDTTAAGSLDKFLESKLEFTKDSGGQEICVVTVGDEEVGVMMGWERNIMRRTVDLLCLDHPNLQDGLNILNVGFGLGIIDGFFQSIPTRPSRHVIVEAHPDVLKHMREQGWYEKPGVTIIEGKWQDIVASLGDRAHPFEGFDVVYTDTFSEDYKQLNSFFSHLPNLLRKPSSRFSFFNGLGATNATFYDVYASLAELHLSKLGMDVEWSEVDIRDDVADKEWGDTRKYFTLPLYRLPVCRLSSS